VCGRGGSGAGGTDTAPSKFTRRVSRTCGSKVKFTGLTQNLHVDPAV
jgi:hypothetical protein